MFLILFALSGINGAWAQDNVSISYAITTNATTLTPTVTNDVNNRISNCSTSLDLVGLSTTNDAKTGYSKAFYTWPAEINKSNNYASLSWTIASGYQMKLTDVSLTVRAKGSSGYKFLAVISDGTTTIESNELTGKAEIDLTFSFPNTLFTKALKGRVTIKIYAYGTESTGSGKKAWVKSPVVVTGNVETETAALNTQDAPVFTVSSTGAITITNKDDAASYYYSTDGNFPVAGQNGEYYSTAVPSGTYYAGDIVMVVHKDNYEDAISTNATPIVVGPLGTLAATTPDKIWNPANIPGIGSEGQAFPNILLFDNTLRVHSNGYVNVANNYFKVNTGTGGWTSGDTPANGLQFHAASSGKLKVSFKHGSSKTDGTRYLVIGTSAGNKLTTDATGGVEKDESKEVIVDVDVDEDKGEGSDIFISTKGGQINISEIKYYTQVNVTGVTLNKNKASLLMDGTTSTTLTATVAPTNATNKNVTWSIVDGSDNYVTISQNGASCTVTGTTAGTATVRATSNDDNTKYSDCVVYVVPALNTISAAMTVKEDTRFGGMTPEQTGSDRVTETINATKNNPGLGSVSANSYRIYATESAGVLLSSGGTIQPQTAASDEAGFIEFKVNGPGFVKVGAVSTHSGGANICIGYGSSKAGATQILSQRSKSNGSNDWISPWAYYSGTSATSIFIYADAKMTLGSFQWVPKSGEPKLELSSSSLTLTKGDETTLSLTKTNIPDGVSPVWESDNTGVVTVDQNGKVTAVGKGTAAIIVKLTDDEENSSLYVTCDVTVVEAVATDGFKTITKSTGEVYSVNKDLMYKYGTDGWAKNGSGGDIASASYYSEKSNKNANNYIDPETEAVSAKGSATGINLKTADNRSARFYFTGADKVAAFIGVCGSDRTATLAVYKASDNFYVKGVTGSSYSSITFDKLVVEGLTSTEKYYAKVTGVSDKDNCLYAMKFWAPAAAAVYTETVSLDKTSLALTTASPATALTATAATEGYNQGLVWTSSNESVATVDQNGNVTPVGAGTTTITVTAKKSSTEDVTATCTVTVTTENIPAGLQTLPSLQTTTWIAGNGTTTTFGNFDAANNTQISGTTLNHNHTLQAYDGNRGIYLYTGSLYFAGAGTISSGDSHLGLLEFRIPTKGKIHVEMKNESEEARSYAVVARYTKKNESTTTEKVLRTMTLFKGDGSNASYGYSTLDAYFEEDEIEGGYATIFIRSTSGGMHLTALSYSPGEESGIDNGDADCDTYSRFSSAATQKLAGIGSEIKVGTRNSNSEVTTPLTIEPKEGYMIEKIEVTWAETTFNSDVDFALTNCNTSKIDGAMTRFVPVEGNKTVTIGHSKDSSPLKVTQVKVYWVKTEKMKNATLRFIQKNALQYSETTDLTNKKVEVWYGQEASAASLPALKAYELNSTTEITEPLIQTNEDKKPKFVSSKDDIVADTDVANYPAFPSNYKFGKIGSTAISVTTAKTANYLPATAEFTLVVKSIAPIFTEQNTMLTGVSTIDLTNPASAAGAKVYFCINPADTENMNWTEYTIKNGTPNLQGLLTLVDGKGEFIIYAKAKLNNEESEVVDHRYVIDQGILIAPKLVIYENEDKTIEFPDNQFNPKHGNLYAVVTNTTAGATVYYEVIQMGFDAEGRNLTDYRGNFADGSDGVNPGIDLNATKTLTIQNSVNIRIWAEYTDPTTGEHKRSEDVIRRIVYNDRNTNVIVESSFKKNGSNQYIEGAKEIQLDGMKITYGGRPETSTTFRNQWKDNWVPMTKRKDNNIDKLGVSGVLTYERLNSDKKREYVSVQCANDVASEYSEFLDDTKNKGKAYPTAKTGFEGAAGNNFTGTKIDAAEYHHNIAGSPVHDRTFNLPVYGAFWKFEPTQNGEIILHVEQQGCLNQTTTNNVKSDVFDAIRIRPVYFVDEQGNSIRAKSFSTEARLDPTFLNFFADPKNNYPSDDQKGRTGKINHFSGYFDGECSAMEYKNISGTDKNTHWYTKEEDYNIFDMYVTFLQETKNGGGYQPTGTSKSIWDTAFEEDDNAPGGWKANSKNENGWGAKQEIIVLHATGTPGVKSDLNPDGYSANLLKKLVAVNAITGDTNFDGTGYMLTTEGYAKYRFPVEAGKTYFFFGWRTKFGVSGYEWIPNPKYLENMYETETVTAEDGETYKKIKEDENGKRKMQNDRHFTLYDNDSDGKNTDILAGKNADFKKEDFYETPATINHGLHRQYNITVNRTFKAQTWAPIVLPFSVSQTQMRQIFGNNVKVIHFDNIEQVNSNDVTYKLNFLRHHYQMLVAGTPAYIYPDGVDGNGKDINKDNPVTNPTFYDVTLEMKTNSGIVPVGDKDGNKMTGSFVDSKVPEGGLFVSNNQMYKNATGQEQDIHALRSWIEWGDSSKAKNAKFVMYMNDVLGGEDEDNQVTAIKFVELGVSERNDSDANAGSRKAVFNNRVYSLKGQFVGTPENIETLPKGIYILNGKKFIKK